MINVTWRQSPNYNSLAENFLLHRKRNPFLRRIWVDPQSAEIIEHLLFVLGQSRALEQVLFPRGHNHFHPEFIWLFQILVQMPPVRSVSQKDQSSVTHQFDAFASAIWINLVFCGN